MIVLSPGSSSLTFLGKVCVFKYFFSCETEMELMCVSIVRSLALFAAGCSLNAEELAISKLGLPR